MNSFAARFKVKDGEVESILKRMDEAQETIRECYDELRSIGVLVIERVPSDKSDGTSKKQLI